MRCWRSREIRNNRGNCIMPYRMVPRFVLCAAVVLVGAELSAILSAAEPKDATASTKAANEKLRMQLPFADEDDFADARRGEIADGLTTIRDARGRAVWDLSGFAFLDGDAAAPDTVNPSLWRQSR